MSLALIPLSPLISFAVLILIGRRLGKAGAAVSLLALLGSLSLSVKAFLSYQASHITQQASVVWISIGDHPIRWGLMADPLSLTMCLVVTVIGWMIMLYSIGYMGEDPRYPRFFATLSLFFGAMLTLVLADNLLLLYIGWEGVGLCSYLLISFWFERESAAKAGKKAFLTTRVGDVGLFLGLLMVGKITGDLSFNDLAGKAAGLGTALGGWAWVPALLIFWGAVGKSAQFPLHVWLPDAMEGPTPVSALIHAATMVAAGVYLVARTLPLFLPNPSALLAVATIGGITSLGAATIACTQTDLKRILAYSTISQLGFMMLGLGAGSSFAGMFHLVTHAWFKALLFLGAGSVIHALHHQEITRMGGLVKPMPVTALTFTIAAVAMAGIPPFSGFWSKEEILAAAAGLGWPFLAAALATSFSTAFYISRAVILTFFGPAREPLHHVHESPLVMTGPLLFLALGAAGIGLIGSEWGGHRFQQFLGVTMEDHHGQEWIPLAAIGIAAGGMALSILRYGCGWKLLPAGLRQGLSPIYQLVFHKYYVDELYEAVIIKPLLRLTQKASSFDTNVVDGAVNQTGVAGLNLSRFKGWVDQVIVDGGVNFVAVTVGRAGAVLRGIQTGLVQNYLLIALGGAVTLFWALRWLY